jgi:hypothetical protein
VVGVGRRLGKALQIAPKNAEDTALVAKKLQKLIDQEDVDAGVVHSLVNTFFVSKVIQGAPNDIRVVYDATKSGFNESVWAPTFFMPSMDSHVWLMDADSWMLDKDAGEFFLNFVLHEDLRPYAGIDFTPFCHTGITRNGRPTRTWKR